MNNSENLRKALESKSIVKVCGAYDSMSAKLVEIYGFDAVSSIEDLKEVGRHIAQDNPYAAYQVLIKAIASGNSIQDNS